MYLVLPICPSDFWRWRTNVFEVLATSDAALFRWDSSSDSSELFISWRSLPLMTHLSFQSRHFLLDERGSPPQNLLLLWLMQSSASSHRSPLLSGTLRCYGAFQGSWGIFSHWPKKFVTDIALYAFSAAVIILPQCENNISSIRGRETGGFKKWSISSWVTSRHFKKLVDMQG